MSNLKLPSVKRWNPYLGEWTILAPVTAGRPWSGAVVGAAKNDQPEFDPSCYLCPGVTRADGEVNPDYKDVYIFNNDFPTLSMEYSVGEHESYEQSDIAAKGICRVVCFSPRHNITLPEMETGDVYKVLEALCSEFKNLSAINEIENVMMFENRGKIIGVSNPHPHGQIYSTDFVPRIPSAMYSNALNFRKEKGGCLFCSVMEQEMLKKQNIVAENDHFVVFVPSFARHTFETHLMPKRHMPFITMLGKDELFSFAEIYREILIRYDNLFSMPFPNITVFQNSPCGKDIDPEPFHFHIEFYPPLRSPDKLKYMAGFESGGGNIINPSLPGDSARALRDVSTVHYSKI